MLKTETKEASIELKRKEGRAEGEFEGRNEATTGRRMGGLG